MDIFYKAGEFWKELRGGTASQPFFTVEIVSEKSKYVKGLNGYPIYCHRTIEEVRETDVILIPGLQEDVKAVLRSNQNLIKWLQDQYRRGAEVASYCTGAFLLAEAGLLTNKSATTHWRAANFFRQRYPDVQLKPDRIITDEGDIFCSGGTTSFLNLTIYLIEKYCGHDVAVHTSKVMLIDMDKVSQSNYVIFSAQKYHDDKVIRAVQDFIENNFKKGMTLDDLASRFHLSKRSLIRRFKAATNNTPLEYLQRVRIEAIKKALETRSDPVQQLIYEVGYSDVSTFRKLFRKYTGISPVQYRKKYQRRIKVA